MQRIRTKRLSTAIILYFTWEIIVIAMDEMVRKWCSKNKSRKKSRSDKRKTTKNAYTWTIRETIKVIDSLSYETECNGNKTVRGLYSRKFLILFHVALQPPFVLVCSAVHSAESSAYNYSAY